MEKQSGFGLVGILIVIGIIGVISAKFFYMPRNSDPDEVSPLEAIQQAEDIKSVLENKVAVGNILDLSGQGLRKVPSYVFDETSIDELNLSNNVLDGALPSEVQRLQKLKVLNLSNNNFTGVPAEVGQLRNLEILDLSDNLLTGLPYELGNLSKLKILDLSGNNYSERDLLEIKKNLPVSTVIKTN